ncbi:alpha-1,2-fucosyltransferase [Acaryochloris sp. IP29b_bin.148]|uniref:alpha-1,2-fucosyltransferase n=1 Tax=Acaryochloris sp. IP29b_bin.148 TaxID=2969218 RepID=UPI00261ED394|nr:alpha-1,2-fucosyltransferase [Acaryochloris sp. IP29b_bin.148]
MLIFRESGRIGNQIFQYSAIRSMCPKNEKLVLIGFEEFQALFNNPEANIINSNSSTIERLLYRFIYKAANFLSKKYIFDRIYEIRFPRNFPRVEHEIGILSHIKFIGESYFQFESAFRDEVPNQLEMNHDLINFAKAFLREKSCSNKCIFIHIRRGDYIKWPNKKNPAVLPASYYYKCIDIIKSKIHNPFFVFLSDDPHYVEDIFGGVKNSVISKFSSFQDFALMTQCEGGILSASSFSWWGSYFASQKHSNLFFLAPKYWAGCRSKSWFPPFVKSSFLNYVDI